MKNVEGQVLFNQYWDFREMLGEMEKQIDVVISTPDHAHFHPAMMALEMGKHCYCEKPMAHSVWEARHLFTQPGFSSPIVQTAARWRRH